MCAFFMTTAQTVKENIVSKPASLRTKNLETNNNQQFAIDPRGGQRPINQLLGMWPEFKWKFQSDDDDEIRMQHQLNIWKLQQYFFISSIFKNNRR